MNSAAVLDYQATWCDNGTRALAPSRRPDSPRPGHTHAHYMPTKGITIMKYDDMVEIGIDGIGVLRNPVVREQ